MARLLLVVAAAVSVWSAPPSGGRPNGKFDPRMKGCERSCAVTLDYRESDLAPQPGAAVGRLTRCPVSGVVFRVLENGPTEAVAGKAYRFCCKSCARLFRRSPRRFLS